MRNALMLAVSVWALACGPSGGGSSKSGDASGSPDQGMPVVADGEASGDLGAIPSGDVYSDAAAPALDCSATLGKGKLTGSIPGESLAATYAGAAEVSLLGMQGFMIGLSATGGTCQDVKGLANGAAMLIQLCDASVGEHDIDDDCVPEGGGIALGNSIGIPKPGADVDASAGIVTIEAYEPVCGGKVKGSFTADFDGNAVTGTFDTVHCGLLKL